MPATTAATKMIFIEDATECMATPAPTKISSRPRQSIPKKTVEVIRAQFLPALLARAIQSHSAKPSIAPGIPVAFEPWRTIRSKIRPSTSSPAPTYMSMTARWIDGGGPEGGCQPSGADARQSGGTDGCQPEGAGACQSEGPGACQPPGYCCPPGYC